MQLKRQPCMQLEQQTAALSRVWAQALTQGCGCQVGDSFNLYWPMIFGEPSKYELQDECNIFWCEPTAPSNGVWHKKGRHSTWGEG